MVGSRDKLGLPEPQLAAIGEMSGTTEVVLVTEPVRPVPHRLQKMRTIRVAPAPRAPKDAKPVDVRDESVWAFTYPAVPVHAPATR